MIIFILGFVAGFGVCILLMLVVVFYQLEKSYKEYIEAE